MSGTFARVISGKKRARPFLELDEEAPSIRRHEGSVARRVCATHSRADFDLKKRRAVYQEVTRFPRSRLSEMHLHCDSRPRSCTLPALVYRRAALRTDERSHSSLSRKGETSVTARASALRTPNWLKTVITRRIRKRALFRRWCKWHVSVIDRKKRNCKAAGAARQSATIGWERKANACTTNEHGKRALLLYPANRSVVLF